MIKVDVFKDKQGMIVGYKVSGHAGYSEEGSDIICSAVSALTQAPLLGLERHLKLKPSLNSAPNDLTQAILQTMVYGIGSIESQCPQYVRIQEHRR